MKHEYYVLIKYKDIQCIKPKFIYAKNMKAAKRKVKRNMDINCDYKIRQIA